MKQHITEEQFKELTFEQQEKLFDLLFPWVPDTSLVHKGVVYRAVNINPEYLTIGRMIELLNKHKKIAGNIEHGEDQNRNAVQIYTLIFAHQLKENSSNIFDALCDGLWEAVKECLN